MVEIKSFGKRKGGAGSGAAGVSAGGSIGESVVREALHAAKADIALQAQKAAEAARAAVADYAAGAGHAATADMATEADHAASAHELDADSPTRREFLSRKKEDSAEKCINFIKGLTVGTDGGHGMNADGDVTARDVTGRKVEADRGSFGDILMRYLSSSGFSSGLIGSGVGIWQDKAGKWHLDIDAITARQSLTVLELLIQRIRAVGGAVVLSQASGKVAEVVETGTGIGSDSYYRLYLEEGGDGDFMAGDLVRCSRWDGDSGDPERMHAYWEEAVKAEWDAARERRFVAIRRPTSTGTVPSAGDELVLMGNTRDKTRQGFIHLTVEAGKPRIAEWAGVDSAVLKPEQMVTCLGDLDGIEWQGRTLEGVGYGLMTRNFYGTGEIVLKSGGTLDGLDERVQSMRQGSRNLVLNSGMWSPDRQITIVPGGPSTGLPEHWRPLNGGCAAAVADGLLVLRKDSGVTGSLARNGLHAGLSRDAIPKGTTLTVKVAGAAGNIAAGKSIQVTLYNTQPGWTHAVTLCRVTAADLAKDGSLSIEKSVTLAEDYSVPRLCVSLHDANEGAFIKLANVGLYAGDRAPELWTPAPDDIEERQAAATEAAKAAADNAQKAADAAKNAADAAAGGVTDLRGYVDDAFKDGIIDTMEAAGIANYINTVNSDKERIKGTYGRLYDNAYLDAAGKEALKEAYDNVASEITALLSAIDSAIADSAVTEKEREAVDGAFTAFNTANGAFSAAVEAANAAIQAAIEAEAREAADKAAQAVADGLSVRNLVPMSGLWESVPGKDDGWGMLNDGCVASVADHRLWLVKDGDGRNGMWARLTVPSLPKGQKVTVRAKGMMGRDFAPGTNDNGTPRRVAIALYDTSTSPWVYSVTLADIREEGEFELTGTVELGRAYINPGLCFSMMDAPEGTGLRLDWVALYAGSWAPEGWNPAPEDAQRIVTVRDVKLTGEFTARADELSQSIESSVTEYRTRFGALRNLLVATRQADGSIAGTREVFVRSRGHVDYDIPVTLGKGKTYRFDFGERQDSHNFRGITVSVLRSDGRVLVAGDDIVFEDEAYSLFIVIPASATGTLSGCRLRVVPLDSESEGTLERLKLSEGTVYSEWTPAPEDAETYREETRTRFSVTDGLIKSEVEKVQGYTDDQCGEIAGQIAQVRRDTKSEIRQTAENITASVDEKVGAVSNDVTALDGKVNTQSSELRSEIAVGTRLISLSVGEKAIPLGSAPYHNLLRHTNQGVTGWTVANSTEGAGAFLIQRQPWANGMDFVKLRRQGTAPSGSSGWEWMRFDGLAPKALQPGKYRLQFHMLAYAQGTFGLSFLPQDTTATGDNTADNLCSAASVPVPVSQMADYSHPDLGPVKKIQKDFDVTLNVTRQGSLDVGNLRIGTTGRANILELNIGNLRLTKGEEPREWTPSTDDYADGLRRTGIDIAQRKITLTSDTVEVKNNIGETTALLDKDGMLETSLVRAEELQTNRFIITDGEGRKVISDNEHGDGARVFYYTGDFPDVTDEAVGVQPMFRVGYDPVTKTFMQHYNPDGTIAWTIGKAGTPTAATLPYSWNDFRLAKITSEGAARNTRDMGGASYHMFRSTSRQDNPERPGEAYADSNGRLFTARSTKASVIADGLYCDSAVGKFTGKNAELEPEGPTVKAASRPVTQGIVTTWGRTVYTVAGGRITDSERITWTTGGTLLPES